MKTVNIQGDSLLSYLSVRGVENQLAKLAGVIRVEVNYVAGSATVVYDEQAIDLKVIKARAHEFGYHCAGGAGVATCLRSRGRCERLFRPHISRSDAVSVTLGLVAFTDDSNAVQALCRFDSATTEDIFS